ncbi:MAG TPA: AI-2E family transporter [Tepidisphaeraceae bacterium]|jgi:predicted PurR-regulated permease PerM|nr:AI-2E family transporter [Tepidisphaeraceae bacterium]
MPARTSPDRHSRFLIFATIFLVVAALYLASDVLIPLALALLVSFLLTPLVTRLERWRLGRIPSVMIVVLAVSGLMASLAYIVSDQTLNLATNLENYRENIINKVQQLKPSGGGPLGNLMGLVTDVQKNLDQPATTQAIAEPAELIASEIAPRTGTRRLRDTGPDATRVAEAATTQPYTEDNPLPVAIVQPQPSPLTQLASYLGLALGPLGTAGLVIVFAIFILLDREDLRDRMVRLVGFGQLNITTKAMDDAATRISRYLLAQAIVNGTYGIAISIGLWIIGRVIGQESFPNVILWGLLCAVLRFIPYVGPWIAAVFPLVVAFAVYPGFGVFIGVVILFATIELLSNNLMEPWLYGSSTGMTTIAVLVSAVFWTWLWGPIGLVIATPLTVCLVVLGKNVPNLKFLDILLGDDPVFAPPERIYQRLLATDAEEASEIADDYLREMSLERVYDEVLMPALAMAEQDRHRNTLDEDRAAYVRRSIREMVDELGDQQRVKVARGLADAEPDDAIATALASARASTGSRFRVPRNCIVNVEILPAHDDADEVVGLMVAQLLQMRGFCATAVSVKSLASEMVEQVERDGAHLVVVSALPPDAVTSSRYLCKRLHQRFKALPMIVGLWSFKGEIAKAKTRIACDESVIIATTLAMTMDHIDQRVQPLLVQLAEGDPAAPSLSQAKTPG